MGNEQSTQQLGQYGSAPQQGQYGSDMRNGYAPQRADSSGGTKAPGTRLSRGSGGSNGYEYNDNSPARQSSGFSGMMSGGVSGLVKRAGGTIMGHALSIGAGGYTTEKGYMQNIDVMIRSQNIAPWPAEDMFRAKLRMQEDLRHSTKLYLIPVELGLMHFVNHMPNYLSTGMKVDTFVSIAQNLLVQNHHEKPQPQALQRIFRSMDYDGNGSLTVGEWSGGLKTFFMGTEEAKNRAVFRLIDTSTDGRLDKDELKEYLRPIMNAMIPIEANSLRPLILSRLLELVFTEIDADGDGTVTSGEFLAWSKEHDLIRVLGKMIEGPVYKVWMRKNLKLGPLDEAGAAAMAAMGVY